MKENENPLALLRTIIKCKLTFIELCASHADILIIVLIVAAFH